MQRFLRQWLIILILALAVPSDAFAISLQDAARQAARQYNAKVLSARTITKGPKRIHEIKLLTKKGVVKTVRIPE
ncbi:MAG: hypothetical protein ACI9CB_002838 [Rhodothermales bacterium]|jgi:hypothetical protein